MKRHLQKKAVTTILFMILLLIFSVNNFINTFPKLKEMDFADINSLDDIGAVIGSAEAIISENIIGRYAFIEGHGLWNKLLNKKEINNFSQTMDEKGYLHYSDFYNTQSKDISWLVNRVIELRDRVKELGTEIIVIMPPSKYMEGYTAFEGGLPYSDNNWAADEYLKLLKENNIKTYDFRKIISESGMPYEEIFYVTDHHWTTKAAFYSYCRFVDKMNQWFDLDLDKDGYMRDMNNYNSLVYKDSNLGAQGRDTGIYYAGGLDDFVLMYPKYTTSFHYEWKVQESESVLDGRFEDTLVSAYNIINSNIYIQDKYSGYLNGIADYDHIVNNLNPTGPKVLFLRDSYTTPFASFFAQVCSETDLLWTYKIKDDLNSYLNKKYDYIIISLYPDSLEENMFRF